MVQQVHQKKEREEKCHIIAASCDSITHMSKSHMSQHIETCLSFTQKENHKESVI